MRHIFFANMALGAPWAAYFLNFEESKYENQYTTKLLKRNYTITHTNYTTVEGRDMWQQYVGYSWWYDFFFSLGGPTEAVRLPFSVTEGNDTTYYIIWCWKADYWNLGAGAEIGIYCTDDAQKAQMLYYEIDETLTVHTHMTIKYLHPLLNQEYTLNDFHQTNWWITSFTPAIQHPKVENIHVSMDVRFTGNNYLPLMKGFESEKVYQQSHGNPNPDWVYANLLSFEIKDDRKTGPHTDHFCSSSPALCTCSCQLNDPNCGAPCSYYDTKCTLASGCTHVNEPENGFQFTLSY